MLQEVSPLPLNLNRSIMKTWPTNEKRCPIIVALRIKPLPSDPCSSHHKSSLRHDFHTVSLRTHYQNHTHSTLRSFSFDHVHNSDTTQESLYQQCAASMVTALVEGFNSTIFAYGQTGSGKTYTMGLCHFRNMESDTLGIAPRLIQDLFKSLESKKYKIHVSFVELYNEQVRDLFTTSQTMSSQDLVIREDKDGHIKIQGTTVHPCKTVDDVLYLLEKGALSRTVGGTQMNHASSRSHAIFTLTLVQTVPIKEGIGFQKLVSKLNLVDLAGSERQKRTCAEGLRFKESIKINSGLLALGNVINSLSQKEMHVPYRDSKLTRILQDSLGGNSVTLLIACVCPLEQSKQETLNTLIYASRARSIENRPILNRSSTLLLNDPPSTVYHDLVEEVHQYLRDPSPTSKKKLIQLLNQIPLSSLSSNSSTTTLIYSEENPGTPGAPLEAPCSQGKCPTPILDDTVDTKTIPSSTEYSLLYMLQLQHQRDQERILDLETRLETLTNKLNSAKTPAVTKKKSQELEYYRKTIHELKRRLRDLLAIKKFTS